MQHLLQSADFRFRMLTENTNFKLSEPENGQSNSSVFFQVLVEMNIGRFFFEKGSCQVLLACAHCGSHKFSFKRFSNKILMKLELMKVQFQYNRMTYIRYIIIIRRK